MLNSKEIVSLDEIDAEQQEKIKQCLELLVAAGYCRARIQGLPHFDKIVGGMAWCIESCCIDVDVDLFYNDSLTIGQKISLTERLVSVLPVMKCPHSLQPHQVQGLDASHILPVLQWLVREALAYRKEFGSISQAVAALHCLPLRPSVASSMLLHDQICAVENKYRYARRWRVKNSKERASLSPTQQVYTTLLEYSPSLDVVETVTSKSCEREEDSESRTLGKIQAAQDRELFIKKHPNLLQHLQGEILLKESFLKAAAEATQISPLPVHKASASSLTEQVATMRSHLGSLQLQGKEQLAKKLQMQQQVRESAQRVEFLDKELLELKKTATRGNDLEQLLELVREAERVKRSEHDYKKQCREHVAQLNHTIKELEEQQLSHSPTVDPALIAMVTEERIKHARVREEAGEAARQLAALKRAWDDVPGRAELAQYRHRLIELDDAVMTSERETRQFETMYRTLQHSRSAMEEHLALLNDLLDNLQLGMQSSQKSAALINKAHTHLQTVQNNLRTVEKEKDEHNAIHTKVSNRLTDLQDAARLYTRTAHALASHVNQNQQLRNALSLD